MNCKQSFFYSDAWNWEHALGLAFVGRAARQKPANIAMFAVKAIQAELQIREEQSYQIMLDDNCYALNPQFTNEGMHATLRTALENLTAIRKTLPKSSMFFISYSTPKEGFSDMVGSTKLSVVRNLSSAQTRQYFAYLEPDFLYKFYLNQMLDELNLAVMPLEETRPGTWTEVAQPPHFYAECFLDVSSIRNINDYKQFAVSFRQRIQAIVDNKTDEIFEKDGKTFKLVKNPYYTHNERPSRGCSIM